MQRTMCSRDARGEIPRHNAMRAIGRQTCAIGLTAFMTCGLASAQPIPPEAHKAVKAIAAGTFLGGMSWGFVVFIALPLAAMVVVLTLARPHLSDRLTEVVGTQRATAFWWGLATTILFLFAFALLAKTKVLGGLALILLIIYSWSLLVGFTGVSRQAGELMLSKSNRPSGSPTLFALLGSLLLTLAALVPVFGWILALYVVCLSVGAFRLGWRGAKTLNESSTGEPTA